LQCVAVCCSVLQCVAVCCSVLQCVAVCCSVLQCVWLRLKSVCSSILYRGESTTLQHTATLCHTLQHVVTYRPWSTLCRGVKHSLYMQTLSLHEWVKSLSLIHMTWLTHHMTSLYVGPRGECLTWVSQISVTHSHDFTHSSHDFWLLYIEWSHVMSESSHVNEWQRLDSPMSNTLP